VLADIAGVPIIDAAGMAALLAAEEHGRSAKVELRVSRPPAHVRRLLVAAGLQRLLLD
jgi:RNA polymerase sigma-B factor